MNLNWDDITDFLDITPFKKEYSVYFNNELQGGREPLSPETWFNCRIQDIVDKNKPKFTPSVPNGTEKKKNSRIEKKFRKIMIDAGHGEFMQRAMYYIGKY